MINKDTLMPEDVVQLLEEHTNDRRPIKHYLKRNASITILIKALEISKMPRTKRILCDILGSRHAKSAIPILISCLADSDWEVRNDAAEALADIRSLKAGEALLQHLINDPLPAYAGALGAIKYYPAIPFLLEALRNPSARLRGIAAWSLGELMAKEALPQLELSLITETDDYAIDHMKEARNKISKED